MWDWMNVIADFILHVWMDTGVGTSPNLRSTERPDKPPQRIDKSNETAPIDLMAHFSELPIELRPHIKPYISQNWPFPLSLVGYDQGYELDNPLFSG